MVMFTPMAARSCWTHSAMATWPEDSLVRYSKLMGVEAAGVAGVWDYPVLTVNYFIREAFGVTHLWVFGW